MMVEIQNPHTEYESSAEQLAHRLFDVWRKSYEDPIEERIEDIGDFLDPVKQSDKQLMVDALEALLDMVSSTLVNDDSSVTVTSEKMKVESVPNEPGYITRERAANDQFLKYIIQLISEYKKESSLYTPDSPRELHLKTDEESRKLKEFETVIKPLVGRIFYSIDTCKDQDVKAEDVEKAKQDAEEELETLSNALDELISQSSNDKDRLHTLDKVIVYQIQITYEMIENEIEPEKNKKIKVLPLKFAHRLIETLSSASKKIYPILNTLRNTSNKDQITR